MAQCEKCGCETEETLQYIIDDGYVQHSESIVLCKDCQKKEIKHMKIGDTLFVKILHKLFYELNGDFGFCGTYVKILNYEHFVWLRDERKSNMFLEGVWFDY